MANVIKLRTSATPGATPVVGDLVLGEVAINTSDGKMFIKKNDGVDAIVEIGAAGAGGTALFVQTTEPVSWVVGDVWIETV